jgi:hypothetical protein
LALPSSALVLRAARRAEEQQVATLRTAAERQIEIDVERPAQRLERLAHELASPLAHGAIAPSCSDSDLVRHEPRRIEVVDRAEALSFLQRAVRRVE